MRGHLRNQIAQERCQGSGWSEVDCNGDFRLGIVDLSSLSPLFLFLCPCISFHCHIPRRILRNVRPRTGKRLLNCPYDLMHSAWLSRDRMSKLDSGSSLAISLLLSVTALYQILVGGQRGGIQNLDLKKCWFRFRWWNIYIHRNECCKSRGAG